MKADAHNPILGRIPIRTGFWDQDANNGKGAGFGFDKAYHFHNIPTLKGLKWALESPTGAEKPQGNRNSQLVSYVAEKVCSSPGQNRVVRPTPEINAIYAPSAGTRFAGWPARNLVGLFGAHCMNPDGAKRSPNWVTIARTSQLPGETASPMDTQRSSSADENVAYVSATNH